MSDVFGEWSYEKPIDEGIYLACLGDVETIDNIYPIRVVLTNDGGSVPFGLCAHGWPCYSPVDLQGWSKSFKFLKIKIKED